MQAIRVHAFGGPEVLRLEEIPDPTPGPGEVLIRLALGAGLRHRTLVPVVGPSFPLRNASAAHAAVMSPGARGKVVLSVP